MTTTATTGDHPHARHVHGRLASDDVVVRVTDLRGLLARVDGPCEVVWPADLLDEEGHVPCGSGRYLA